MQVNTERTTRILVADMDGSLSGVIRSMVADEAQVYAATDGWSAIELAREFQPDVSILGLTTGFPQRELYTGVRACSDGYIIVLCPSGAPEDRIWALNEGADDCVSRPFEQRELTARVRALLRRGRSPRPTLPDE